MSFHSLGLFCSIEQKFIILMKSSISVFSFMDPTYHVIAYLSPHSRSSRFSPILSSRCSTVFTVLYSLFTSVIHSELNFVRAVRSVPIRFLHVHVQLFQRRLSKRRSLLHYVALFLCQGSAVFIAVCFWTLLCYSDLFAGLSPMPHCLDCCSFIGSL